jgi:nitrate reductase gamma subunit
VEKRVRVNPELVDFVFMALVLATLVLGTLLVSFEFALFLLTIIALVGLPIEMGIKDAISKEEQLRKQLELLRELLEERRRLYEELEERAEG